MILKRSLRAYFTLMNFLLSNSILFYLTITDIELKVYVYQNKNVSSLNMTFFFMVRFCDPQMSTIVVRLSVNNWL